MESMQRMTCDEAVRRFFAYLDKALDGEQAEALQEHLEHCLDCCDRLEFSRKLDGFVKQRLGETPLPEDLEARIRKVLGK